MPKRRSRIREAVNKVLYQGFTDYKVIYIDRDPQAGERLKELSVSRIARVTGWALYLDDGETVIPLHRIVEIRDARGHTVWRRSGGQDTG